MTWYVISARDVGQARLSRGPEGSPQGERLHCSFDICLRRCASEAEVAVSIPAPDIFFFISSLFNFFCINPHPLDISFNHIHVKYILHQMGKFEKFI